MPDYFEKIKQYLWIHFDDSDNDQRLSGICTRAEAKLNRLIGYNAQYSINMDDKALLQLLFDLIRYTWDSAADEFEADYADEIAGFRGNKQVNDYAESEEENI